MDGKIGSSLHLPQRCHGSNWNSVLSILGRIVCIRLLGAMRLGPFSLPGIVSVLVLALPAAVWASTFVGSHKKVDLAFLHNVPSEKLAEFIQNEIAIPKTQQSETISIDISSCSLGDTGLLKILEVFEPSFDNNDTETHESFPKLALSCGMNDLTPVCAQKLFEKFLHPSNTMPLSELDLSWNHLATDDGMIVGEDEKFLQVLEQTIANQNSSSLLTSLHLMQCGLGPATCRAIAQGIMKRNATAPFTLNLARNPWVANGGTAALAAAMRHLALQITKDFNDSAEEKNKEALSHNTTQQARQGNNSEDEKDHLRPNATTIAIASAEASPEMPIVIFDVLDLSGCGLTDAGAKAFALALEDSDHCIAARSLNLAHNQITEDGATALGRALLLSSGRCIESLDLSNNPIGDRGALHLAAALENGKVQELILRSSHIHADGASSFGKALNTLTTQARFGRKLLRVSIDLSGNALGMLRGKSKKPGEGGKYSASRLKSTAAATAASYMSRIKKGIKDSGVGDFMGSSANDDSDDEEAEGKDENDSDTEESSDASKKRCGAKALVNSFLGTFSEEEPKTSSPSSPRVLIQLGLRHTFLDHGAADALAALLVEAEEKRNVEIEMDLALNPVLEEDMVEALEEKHDGGYHDDLRQEMAERYMDILHAVQEAKRRATEARERARMVKHSSQSRWSDESGEDEYGNHDDAFDDFLEDDMMYDQQWEDDDYDEAGPFD